MDSDTEVPMWHFLCRVCGMSATIVSTPVGHEAWEDHMQIHYDSHDFEAWTWKALRLFPVKDLQ